MTLKHKIGLFFLLIVLSILFTGCSANHPEPDCVRYEVRTNINNTLIDTCDAVWVYGNRLDYTFWHCDNFENLDGSAEYLNINTVRTC